MSIRLLNPDVLAKMGFDVGSMRLRSNENLREGGQENWVQLLAPNATDEDRAACEAFKDEGAAFFLKDLGGWFMVRACMIAGETISFKVEPTEATEIAEIMDTLEEMRPAAELERNEASHLIEGLQSLALMFSRAADHVIENGELKAKLAEYKKAWEEYGLPGDGPGDDGTTTVYPHDRTENDDKPEGDAIEDHRLHSLHNQEYPH